MTKTKIEIPKSLREIWEVKERIYQETKDMSSEEFFNYLEENTRELKSLLKNKNANTLKH